MDKIMIKLMDLESARECIENCQKGLREDMAIVDGEEYLKKKEIYYKNKIELDEVNKKIEILNNALDIIEGIGV
jgi:hypothetical protein